VAALAGRSSRTPCGADEAGMQRKRLEERLEKWILITECCQWQEVSREDSVYSDHCLALRDVTGFRKLFQNRNIITTRPTRI